MSTVVVITGPSGVGKGTLIARLLDQLPQFELSISATTRQPRAGESHGINYWFLSDKEFRRRVGCGDFLEYAEYSGAAYGTLRSEVERRLAQGRSVILEIEVQGARQLRQSLPQALQVFIAPPSLEDLKRRLKKRGTESSQQIERRLAVAEQELIAQHEFPYIVVNDNLEQATKELTELIQAKIAVSP